MALAAVVMFAIALFGSLPSGPPDAAPEPTHRLYVGDLAPGEVRIDDWNGRRVILLRRTPAMIAALTGLEDALRDPDSNASRQPPAALNPGRSLRPDLFVGLAYGTGMGCPLEFVPAEVPMRGIPWAGGFRDRCDGSLFDTAGRVYRGQPARTNLVVPPHREADNDHIELEKER